MSWKTELIEILPDGTKRYRATRVKEVSTNIGQNWHGYVMAVTCPVCGQRGGLKAHYFRNTIYSKWGGPYFWVSHSEYSKIKFSKLRDGGMRWEQARGLSIINKPYCYIGKNYPDHISVDIPEPPEGA